MATTTFLVTRSTTISTATTTNLGPWALESINVTGITLFINVTTASGTTPTMTVEIQGVDPFSGNAVSLPAQVITASITTTGTYILQNGAGVTGVANKAFGNLMPTQWRISIVTGGTPTFTFSIQAVLHET